MDLESLTRPELIFCHLPGKDPRSVLQEMSKRIAAEKLVPDAEELFRRLVEREKLSSTGIGSGVAIPHCKMEGLSEPILAIGVKEGAGIDFKAIDDKPVRLFFLVVSPEDAPAVHLQVLAAVSRWLRSNEHAARLLDCSGPVGILELLHAEGTV